MKDFLKFNKLRRLNNIDNLNIGKNIVPFILLLVINSYFFPENDNFFFIFFQMMVLVSATIFLFDADFDTTISLMNSYPISNKKRKVYKTLYALMFAVLGFLVMILFFTSIDLISYLVNGEVSEGVVDNMPYSLYHLGFNISMLFFYYFMASIKRSKKWWGILVSGYLVYVVINMLSRYVLFNDAFIKKSITLNDYANIGVNIYYFSIIGLFIVSAITFILINARNTRVEKEVN